ncbi:MAG: DUF4402 domain-containing protein [Sphingomicrobium sp.]
MKLTLYPPLMDFVSRLPLLMVGLSTALVPVASAAAPIAAPTPPAAEATLMRPLTLAKLEDMDFGILAAPSAGTAIIEPISNTMGVGGGVIAIGGTPHAARFAGSTYSSSVVIIRIPNGSVLLTRAGGTETIAVNNFTLDGQSKRTMAKAGVFEFAVGATLRPTANPVEGIYTGTFDVTIQYP